MSNKSKSKYSIVKGKTGKSKKVIVAGKKKVLYKKQGSTSKYVLSKGRQIKLTKYKRMKTNKPQKGGNVLNKLLGLGTNQEGGRRKRRRRR